MEQNGSKWSIFTHFGVKFVWKLCGNKKGLDIMQTVKVTLTFLKKLQVGTVQKYADSEIRGFCIYVGKKTISFVLRKRQGTVVKELVLGRYPDITLEEARQTALEKLAAIAIYAHISSPISRKQPLVRDAIKLWLESQKNRNAQYSMRCFDSIANRRIVDLEPATLERIFAGLKDTPSMANHSFRYLKTAINKTYKMLRQESPVSRLFAGITNYPTKARNRTMREDEAPKIIQKLKEYTKKPMFAEQAEALLLMLFTGQRKSKVLGITVEQIDTHLQVWHVPGNDIKRPVDLSLNDYAWNIIAPRIEKYKTGHLFFWRGKPMQNCRKTMLAVCRECGIEDLHIHDLRRSLGTWMLSTGATIEEVSKTLGHSSIRVTEQVYAHLLGSKGRKATNAAIDAMIKGEV
jgi:integrase